LLSLVIRLRCMEGGLIGGPPVSRNTRNVTGDQENRDRVDCRRNSPIA
jgi:hypothetical protein